LSALRRRGVSLRKRQRLRDWRPGRRLAIAWRAVQVVYFLGVFWLSSVWAPGLIYVWVALAVLLTAMSVRDRLREFLAVVFVPTDLASYQRATPRRYEESIAALFRRARCPKVMLMDRTDAASDFLVVTPQGTRTLIHATQCPTNIMVGEQHIEQADRMRDYHFCDEGIIVTTTNYTPAARKLAHRLRIRLIDGHQLEQWASRTGPAPWM
jgi:hypothetical protein